MLSVDASGTALLQRKFLRHIDQSGRFVIPANVKRFSMDVGFNVGKVMIGAWVRHYPDTFGIGLEANPYLVALFDVVVTEHQYPHGFEGLYWHAKNTSAVQLARIYRVCVGVSLMSKSCKSDDAHTCRSLQTVNGCFTARTSLCGTHTHAPALYGWEEAVSDARGVTIHIPVPLRCNRWYHGTEQRHAML